MEALPGDGGLARFQRHAHCLPRWLNGVSQRGISFVDQEAHLLQGVAGKQSSP